MNGWRVERSTGSAEEFHHRALDGIVDPTVWIHRVNRRALVLGSTQRAPIVDTALATDLDVEVCRRRSGGGLVLVDPADSCWIDVVVPRTSRLWDDDVNRAFWWFGDVWARALASCGVDGTTVHRGPLLRAEAGRFLCFAGAGPGEVFLGDPTEPAGRARKLVGLSQRRRRDVARLQGLCVAATDLELTRRLVLPAAWPADLALDTVHVGLDPDGPVGRDPAERAAVVAAALPDAVVAALPDPG